MPGPFAKLGAWLQNRLPWGDAFVRPWMIDRANDHYAVDIGRARRLLEWNPRHALRTTLPVMVGALESDPAAWYREHGLEPGRAPYVEPPVGEQREGRDQQHRAEPRSPRTIDAGVLERHQRERRHEDHVEAHADHDHARPEVGG
ncbi:MAG: hypothetical protein J0L92_21640 [Deltaproteobacteria bacterium]|nr:hypothetical protein [Deltaproteobacteria bacterium]